MTPEIVAQGIALFLSRVGVIVLVLLVPYAFIRIAILLKSERDDDARYAAAEGMTLKQFQKREKETLDRLYSPKA